MSSLIFIAISIFIVARLYVLNGTEAGLVGLIVVISLALMIRFADFLMNTVFRFGFIASKASDYKSPQNSVPALIFLAWVFLILLAIVIAAN